MTRDQKFEVEGASASTASLKRVGFLRVSRAKLEAKIEENPENGEAYEKLGYVLQEQEHYAEAAERLEQALSLGCNGSRLWRAMGHCFFCLDNVDWRSIRFYNDDAQ